MFFEFILKIRSNERSPFEVKYKCCVPKSRYDWVYSKYFREVSRDPRNSVLLINELDEHGDFVQVIQ